MRKEAIYLVIEGLHEGEQGREDIHDILSQLFEALEIREKLSYDQAYRLGAFNPRRPRPLFISFVRVDDRDLVYSARTTLQKSANHYNVWINEDITPDMRRTRNILRQVANEAKVAGARATSTPHAVIITSKRYETGNLESLSEHLTLEKMKTKKMTNPKTGLELLAYHSEHSPFSNLYASPFQVGKREFLCVEHILQYKRAH